MEGENAEHGVGLFFFSHLRCILKITSQILCGEGEALLPIPSVELGDPEMISRSSIYYNKHVSTSSFNALYKNLSVQNRSIGMELGAGSGDYSPQFPGLFPVLMNFK